MPTLRFSAVTPSGVATSQPADSVTLPTAAGEITVLPSHIPLVSVLIPGIVTVRTGEKEQEFTVTGGFIQVTGDETVILAETAEPTGRGKRARQES
jgi:F-type H+-transporting ATPase subunit epsilon